MFMVACLAMNMSVQSEKVYGPFHKETPKPDPLPAKWANLKSAHYVASVIRSNLIKDVENTTIICFRNVYMVQISHIFLESSSTLYMLRIDLTISTSQHILETLITL